MDPNTFNQNINGSMPNPMASPNPMANPNPMASPNIAQEPTNLNPPVMPQQNPFNAAAGEILAQNQMQNPTPVQPEAPQMPTMDTLIRQNEQTEVQAQQPIPQATNTANNAQQPTQKRSIGALIPIFVLFLISFGLLAFGVAQYTRAENNNNRVLELQEKLNKQNLADDAISPLEDEEITEKVENFYKLLRLSQIGTREQVFEYIGVNGYASSDKDDEGYIISPAKFSTVRNAMRKFATDGLANDFNLYRGIQNVDGELHYKPSANDESNGVKYKDKIQTIKLIKSDNLHYEISISTTTIKSDDTTNEQTDIHTIDAYFIIDKDNKYVLNQIVDSN